MKFKALFITFNIVLFLSFLTIFLLPFFILDGTFMADFWVENWFFGIVYLVILAAVNFIFITHWKMVSFLEKEDWPGLAQYLEGAVFERKNYGKRNVGLLCDALLLLGDFAGLAKLETVLRTERPRLFASMGVKFAAAGLLSGDYEALHRLASSLCEAKGADRDWLAFYAAFALHLSKKFEGAGDGFSGLAVHAKDPLVTALAGYLAGLLASRDPGAAKADLLTASEGAKRRILSDYSRKKWDAAVEDAKAEMQVVVLGKLLGETAAWLYGE